MKNSILSVLLTILLSLTLIGCGGKADDKITADISLKASEEMINLSNNYPNSKNIVSSADGATSVEIFDDKLNDMAITFGNDPVISKSSSLISKIKVDGTSFNLDSYPLYKDSLEIYYGSESQKIDKLIDEINNGLENATKDKPAKIAPFKNDDEYIVGTVSLNNNGSYDIMFVCSNNY